MQENDIPKDERPPKNKNMAVFSLAKSNQDRYRCSLPNAKPVQLESKQRFLFYCKQKKLFSERSMEYSKQAMCFIVMFQAMECQHS